MADTESDWPDRLLRKLADAPLVAEPAVDSPKTYRLAEFSFLTPRELEVLHYASLGLENSHIADMLFVTVETVKTHLKAARYRLCAKNTTHACCLAIRAGLFE